MTGPIALEIGKKWKPPKPVVGPVANGKSGTEQAKLEKAELRLYNPAAASGGSKAGTRRGEITFQFNPKEVTIAKTAKWDRKPTKGAQKADPPEFGGAEGCKLTLEMFFDATNTQDDSVVKAVEQLFSCCVPTEESAGKKKPSPPIVVLHWGAIFSFPAYVTSVSAKYTLFTGGGMPIRAVVSVAMEEMPGEPFRQNPTSGSADVRRVHRTVAGDTLASVAYGEYGDPTEWRALAAYNGIDDPLRVRTGTTLLLPAPEELAAAR